ncbi:unnamed protein product [Linum trigynum]|uniref:Ubiquitin-like protease family profile domain-containing protein n=1 Tax=Linum trigynum TaxID=586398 RepID=A0AAV2G2K9_9ROSI
MQWFFPYCDGEHYIMICVNIKNTRFDVLDSLRYKDFEKTYKPMAERVFNYAINYMSVYCGNRQIPWEKFDWFNLGKITQPDKLSCGLYIIRWMRHWEGKYKTFMQSDWKRVDLINEDRECIMLDIILDKENLERDRIMKAATKYCAMKNQGK